MKSLLSKPEKFTNYEAISPAMRAARKWDEREGEIIVQNYNLRRLLVGMDGQSGLQVSKRECYAIYRGSRHDNRHGAKCGNGRGE